MRNQKGGLKLKNPMKQGFKAVYDMINSPSCVLKVLTISSLKGFMIKMNVSPDDSEYLKLIGSRFTEPETSYLLKFVVTTPKNDETLRDFKTFNKSSESQESFFEEAKLQQKIWKKSIIGGRPAICPPVANFSLFDNSNSKQLLQFLKNLPNAKAGQKEMDVFNFLFNIINYPGNTDCGIGIIVMPSVENSDTFSKFTQTAVGQDFKGITMTDSIKNEGYSCLSAQAVRLFADIGVIHFDLHDGNALMYNAGGQIKCLLIDFGRASDITNGKDDDYFTTSDKNGLIIKKNDIYNSIFMPRTRSTVPSPDRNAMVILDTMNFLKAKDHEKNQMLFNMASPSDYQMVWYEKYPPGAAKRAFEILLASISSEGRMLDTTIKSYETIGALVNFDQPLPPNDYSPFMVNFSSLGPPSPSSICSGSGTAPGMCVISGGLKRKTKRQLRNRRKSRRRQNKKSRRRN